MRELMRATVIGDELVTPPSPRTADRRGAGPARRPRPDYDLIWRAGGDGDGRPDRMRDPRTGRFAPADCHSTAVMNIARFRLPASRAGHRGWRSRSSRRGPTRRNPRLSAMGERGPALFLEAGSVEEMNAAILPRGHAEFVDRGDWTAVPSRAIWVALTPTAPPGCAHPTSMTSRADPRGCCSNR